MTDSERDAVPHDLRTAKRWLLWKMVPSDSPEKKPRKIPYYVTGIARNGDLDAAADLAQLASFDAACRVLNRGGYTGLGFALGPDGSGKCYQGIDLDGLSKNTLIAPFAIALPSYTERSPGGDGVHAIGYGREFDTLSSTGNSSGIEAYAKGRFFTFTGKALAARPLVCLADFVEQKLKPAHIAAGKANRQTHQQPPPKRDHDDGEVDLPVLRSALFFLSADDRHLWQSMGHALKTIGDEGRALWLEWSATSDKFDPKDDERTWESFRPTRTGWLAVLAEAMRWGWVNPGSSKPSSANSGGAIDLDKFCLNGSSEEMEKAMLDEVHILKYIAILGQSTVLYSKPNTGKTLLTIYQIIEAIDDGIIDPANVYYINADDTHRGLTFKLKLAERYGFRMLAPGYNGFKAEMLAGILAGMVSRETAHGKIIVLDTVKKFVEIMDKTKATKFGETARQFVSKGGSIVSLAHCNKHRGTDGKVIYAGTSDLVDDADCAYTLDVVTDAHDGTRTVCFENIKQRGDVALQVAFTYDASGGLDYQQRLDSVRRLSDAEQQAAASQQREEEVYTRNREAIDAICESLKAGVTLKTDLVRAAQEASGLSRKQILRALADHTGPNVTRRQYWTVTKGERHSAVYKLNFV